MNKFDSQLPYIASYIFVQNEKGEIAFVLRSNTNWMNNHYGLPAGKTERRETFSEGAIREAKEEIGITVDSKNIKHVLTMHRHSAEKDGSEMDWVDVFFEVLSYSGEVHNAEPHMHSEVAWFSPDRLPENVIPNVKAAVDAYVKGEKYVEFGW